MTCGVLLAIVAIAVVAVLAILALVVTSAWVGIERALALARHRSTDALQRSGSNS
jgi:hypothetical protein